jgi:4-hydroxymandelate synthase
MTIADIDHIEFYVGDAKQAAFYFCTAFGFQVCGQGAPETGLVDQRSLLLRQGSINILLTSGLTADHPATEYVRRHGDGVAVVGFGVADAAAEHAELVRRGAENLGEPAGGGSDPLTAMVSAFGDVTHRLVERRDPAGSFLPGIVSTERAGPDGPLDAIDHLAICVPADRLADTIGCYQERFGFRRIFDEYIDVGGQGMISTVVQSPSRGVTFTLIAPDTSRRPGQIDDFLDRHAGAGVQHLAFRTDDMVAAVSGLAARGVRFLQTPRSYYDTLTERIGALRVSVERLRELSILVDQDHHGQLLQIFTESAHVRRTLFLEVIERQGALTFGSSNIRALYEAKERELAMSVGDRDSAGVASGKRS